MTERDFIALTIYGEARGEPIEGKIAVANVLRNRKQTGRWGQTYEHVCLSPLQFSCWSAQGGVSNFETLGALATQVERGQAPNDPILRECYGVATALSEWIRDNTRGSTHYHTTLLRPRPKWADGRPPTALIGGHLFYAGIR